MKKIISMLVAIATIMCLFCGCGQKYTEFEDEKALFNHIKGIWYYDFDGVYYLITDSQIYEISESAIAGHIEDYLLEVAQKDYSKFEKITAKESLEYVDSRLEDYILEDYTIQPKKGKILLDDDEYLLVYEDTLNYVDESIEDVEICEKISDSTSVINKEFESCFELAQEDFTLSVDDFKATLNECAERIKKNHKNIKSLKKVNDQIYTDTGYASENTYDTVFMVTDSSVLYSTCDGDKKYTFTYMPELCALAHDTTGKMSLRKLVDDALTCISDFPLALTTDKLIDMYEEKKEYKYGGYSFNETIDGVGYSITDSGNVLVVRIGLD